MERELAVTTVDRRDMGGGSLEGGGVDGEATGVRGLQGGDDGDLVTGVGRGRGMRGAEKEGIAAVVVVMVAAEAAAGRVG